MTGVQTCALPISQIRKKQGVIIMNKANKSNIKIAAIVKILRNKLKREELKHGSEKKTAKKSKLKYEPQIGKKPS